MSADRQLTEAEKARLRFTLETAPNGLGLDRIVRAIRAAGGRAGSDDVQRELDAMAERGECRKLPHPGREGEFMYGCIVTMS